MRALQFGFFIGSLLFASASSQANFIVDSTYDGTTFSTGFFSAGYDVGTDNSTSRASLIQVGGASTLDLLKLTIPLALRDPNVNIGDFTLSIQTDASNKPSGTAIWTTAPLGATITAANLSYDLTGVQVAGGQNYWLVLAQNTTLGDTGSGLGSSSLNGINWYFATTFDPTGERAVQTAVASSGAAPSGSDPWVVQTTSSPRSPLAYELQAVPEPGQVAMSLLLLGGFGAYWLRRRYALIGPA